MYNGELGWNKQGHFPATMLVLR